MAIATAIEKGEVLLAQKLLTKDFKEQVAQSCGEPIETVTAVTWVWEWWPVRDDGKAYIDCIGPSQFISYRPLDVAGVGIIASVGLIFLTVKRKQ